MTINIPTSLKDITLRQFVELEASDKTNEDIVQILCDIESTRLLSLKDFQDITDMCIEVLNQTPEFYRRFSYKGIDYGFIPKLDNLTTAEFIDLEMYMAKPETFHKAMSILYRPVTIYKRNWFKKEQPFYDIENYKGSTEIFIDAPAVYYLGACGFFFDLMNDLGNYMTAYSTAILTRSKVKKADLMPSGDGMLASELCAS